MTNFTALYADIILKKIVTKIRKDTNMKNKATERKLANASDGRSVRTMRHWSAAASSEFYYKEMTTGYERMRDLDKLTKWSEKLNQDRFKFMDKFQEVLEYYNLHYKEREADMRKETAPKEVVDFINEKIEQDCTLGQVAEYFYHIMEFESTWSNFPYIVKWGRLNFTLFAELWIDRLKEGRT